MSGGIPARQAVDRVAVLQRNNVVTKDGLKYIKKSSFHTLPIHFSQWNETRTLLATSGPRYTGTPAYRPIADYTQAPVKYIDASPVLTKSSTHTSTGSGPIVFGQDSDLSGWLHRPGAAANKPAIVICNPVGFEFVRAFRSLRVLAEELAAAGHLVLRFDYRTTGDSAGSELDDNRVEALLASTREAIEFVARVNGNERVALLGLRLGATLAAKVAESKAVEQLVLWAPCDSGAIYLREQQIMAAAQKKKLSDSTEHALGVDGVDAGGFLITPAMQADLPGLTLGTNRFPGNPDILLLNRDDIRVPPGLGEQMASRGSTFEVAASPGFKDMMQPPQLSKIPGDAIRRIVAWFQTHAVSDGDRTHVALEPAGEARTLKPGYGIEERPMQFGPGDRLFGIVTRPSQPSGATKPAVILLCGGATHRISANRMYVTLARRLAENGTPVMRMDIAGIGDSQPHDGYPAGKPYTDRLADDVSAAMDTLEATTGARRFILFGLCSGAYAAMHTARQSERVAGLMLANQLVYDLSTRDLQRLASGEIASAHQLDFPRSSSLPYRATVRLLKRLSPTWGGPGEWLAPWLLGTNVRRDLDSLVARGIRLAFLLSSRDKAVDALSIAAGKRLLELVAAGQATKAIFSGTDHTFSPTGSQHALVDWVADYVGGFEDA